MTTDVIMYTVDDSAQRFPVTGSWFGRVCRDGGESGEFTESVEARPGSTNGREWYKAMVTMVDQADLFNPPIIKGKADV